MDIQKRNVYHIFTMGFCGAEERREQCTDQKHRLGNVEKLIPYLKKLGINTILFGPLFESLSHGYDTLDYRRVDQRLGTNEELKDLIDTLHENGFEVLLDCVFNHVGRGHFAVQDLLKNREGATHKDWFVNVNFWGNNSYNDGLWYENWAGYDELVKLNLNNPDVRSYLKETLKFWIDTFDIDGVRLDAANVMSPSFLAELSDYARSLKNGFFLFGEIVGGDYGNFIEQGHLDSCTNYEGYKSAYSALNSRNYFEIAHNIRRLMGEYGVAKGHPLSNFVDNHDVNRVASTLRDERLLIPLYTLLYTMPGYPTVYYGSEQGTKGEKGHGTDAPLRPPYEALHFDPENGLFKHIQKLGKIRSLSEVLQYGDYKEGFIRSEQYGFERTYRGERVYIVLNMNEATQSVPANLFGSYIDALTGEELSLNGEIPVEAFSGRILFESGKEPKIDMDQKNTNEPVLMNETADGAVLETIENLPTGAQKRAEEESDDEDGESCGQEEILSVKEEDDDKPSLVEEDVKEISEHRFASSMRSFMEEALNEAELAFEEGEVPVGAVVVKDGMIIARAHNQKEILNDPTAHAEILALREAASILGDWRLSGCSLYVTAEPCPMCMGAVLQTRLERLVYGTPEMRFGAVENNERLMNHEMIPRKLEIYGGILQDACAGILSSFFSDKKKE